MNESHPNDLPVCTAATSDAGHLIPLSVAANRLPWMPRHVHVATLYRWTAKGVRGLKLKSYKVGRQRCTTEAELLAFFTALAEADLREVLPIARPALSKERERAAQRAKEILKRSNRTSGKCASDQEAT